MVEDIYLTKLQKLILMRNSSISNQKWKPFYFTEVFTEIQRGKRLKKTEHQLGNTPYVSSTSFNNGVDGFIGNNDGVRIFENCLSIANSGSVGSAFYHTYEFIASDHVTQLKREGLDKYAYLFMLPIISRLSEKYSFNREINDERIKREKILLPITNNGDIDFQFMSSFMRRIECQIFKPIRDKLCRQLVVNRLKNKECKLPRSKWKEFVLGEEFSIESTQSGIDKNKLIVKEGGIPYITRSDNTNGIDMFVCTQSAKYKVDEGNVITIGLDTQTVFYQPTEFYTGQNIQIIRHKDLDRYNAQFLIVAIKKLVNKFSWGSYGATLSRLRKSKIYLPINEEGEIDFQFMSSFMKQIEKDILATYATCRTLPTSTAKVQSGDFATANE